MYLLVYVEKNIRWLGQLTSVIASAQFTMVNKGFAVERVLPYIPCKYQIKIKNVFTFVKT